MERRHYILATAGHIDHGKSALIRALGCGGADRLPEEKRRGITIDLGFAHLDLDPDLNSQKPASASAVPTHLETVGFRLGIIDVPGHEDFVRNMVAGVGSVDVGLLVVAADDGWMPQTEEHYQILEYLGVRRLAVAVTKIDAARSATEREEVFGRIRERLKGGRFAEAPLTATSASTGEGLEELKRRLVQILSATPPPADAGKPRLPVDRVFLLKGVGTVATGTLTGGTLHAEQTVLVQPGGRIAKVRALQCYGEAHRSVPPGCRTGVNLAISSGPEARGLDRGDVIFSSGLGQSARRFDAWIERRQSGDDKAGGGLPIKNGATLHLHAAAGRYPCRIFLGEKRPLAPGQTGLAHLELEHEAPMLIGDRFVLRDGSERRTLAGGVTLEIEAGRRRFRTEAQARYLRECARAPGEPATYLRARLQRDKAADPQKLWEQSMFSEDAIQSAAHRLTAEGAALWKADWLTDAERWQEELRRLGERVDAEHEKFPQRWGLDLTELRAFAATLFPQENLCDALLSDLEERGYSRTGAVIRRTSHRPELPPRLQESGERLRLLLNQRPFDPPGPSGLVQGGLDEAALKFLLDTGEAIRFSTDAILAAWAFKRMKKLIVRRLEKEGKATVSDLRQTLGTSRRILVPVLERLDREGVTERQGDWRRLKTNA